MSAAKKQVCLFSQFFNLFIFLKVCIELSEVRISLCLEDLVDHVYKDCDIGREGQRADDRVNRGVIA